MDVLLQDLRYSLRTLLKNRGVTLLAVLCLALGIGVNTTIFSIVDTVAIRPLPYEAPERLVALHETQVKGRVRFGDVSWINLRDWRAQTRTLEQIGALTGRSITLSDGEEPVRVIGAGVSWTLFPMLGVRPIVGRVFREDEDRPGAPGVLLLSHDLWEQRYLGDASVVGRTIIVNGAPHTIVGVMPPRFRFPGNELAWIPLQPLVETNPRGTRDTVVFARLAPDASIDQARGELRRIAAQLETQYPDENRGWTATVRPLRERFMPEDIRLIVATMMGAVTLVLLIACANVANLLLARATARHREIALRAALGAGRVRIVRQLLTESVVIALLAAPLGVVIAYWGLRWIASAIPPNDVPYYIVFEVNRTSLAYTAIVAVATGLLFGLAPALQASKGKLVDALREGSRGSGVSGRRSRLRSSLVVAEVALSLILLVGASLFVRSFLNLQRASPGFDPQPLLTLRVYLPGATYEPDAPKAQRMDDIVRRIEALPGVVGAAASNLIPVDGGGARTTILVDGRWYAPDEEPSVTWAGVTAHFLRTLGAPIVSGRDLTDEEGATRAKTAIVNQTMARSIWGREDVVGQRFRRASDGGDWLTVVGVVSDIAHGELNQREPQPSFYVGYPYMATRNTGLTIRVRSDAPEAVSSAVRQAIRESDAQLPVFAMLSMNNVIAESYWQFKLFGWMFSVFGAVALLLAAMGVYGVLAYSVSQRTHEIGVRVALGAGRGAVLDLVVMHGLKLACAGIVLGALGAFGVTRVISTMLFNVSPTDPLSFAGVSLFLVGIAALASYLPARRAAAVDPIIALRDG